MGQSSKRGSTPTRKLTPAQRRRRLERRREQLMIMMPSLVIVAVIAVALVVAQPVGGRRNQRAAMEMPEVKPPTVEETTPSEGVVKTKGVFAVVDSDFEYEVVFGDGSAAEDKAPADSEAAADAENAADSEGAADADGAADGESAAEDVPATDGDASVGDEGAVNDEAATDGEGATDAEAAEEAAPESAQRDDAYVPESGKFVYDDAYVAAALGKDTGAYITTDLSMVDVEKVYRWPDSSPSRMPILYKANTSEKIIAITVDDCFQGENLNEIVKCAMNNDAKLTIFPIGDNLKMEAVASTVKYAWENGFEIENHTYDHVGMYHGDDEHMRKEMWDQSMRLNQVLGVNYQQHFFRPKGGDERDDQRVHAFANQMGMKGIAIWTQSGSSLELNQLTLEPGAIYLFHTTDKDLAKLLKFIPKVRENGYRMVTLNEMFGLPDNETSELTDPVDPPELEAFHIIPITLQQTSYVRAAYVVQKRLVELGWLDEEADGVFGQRSSQATRNFQLAAGVDADGKAGAYTQEILFSDDAPRATEENKAKVKAAMSGGADASEGEAA